MTELQRLLQDLEKDTPDAALRLRYCLHRPIGLNLGGETPEEIALAIVAEIQAVAAGRLAGFMRESPPPIHRTLHRVGEESQTTDSVAALCSVSA